MYARSLTASTPPCRNRPPPVVSVRSVIASLHRWLIDDSGFYPREDGWAPLYAYRSSSEVSFASGRSRLGEVETGVHPLTHQRIPVCL